MRTQIVAALTFCLLFVPPARSAPNLEAMKPEQVVRVLLKLDKMQDGTEGWAREPAYSRLFSRSYRHARDLLNSVPGNWWDADELSGSQQGGMVLTKITGEDHPSPNTTVIHAIYAIGQNGVPDADEADHNLKVDFTLIKEDDVWKIDEIANAGGGNHKIFNQLTQGCFDCMGGGDHVDWIIQYFYTRIPICNNDGYDDAERQLACAVIKEIASKLTSHNYCYGKKGQAGYEMVWDKCGPDSIRPDRH